MTTVTERSGNGGGPMGAGPENKLSATNRTVAAAHGTEIPEYVGEIVTDLAGHQNYVGTGVGANTDWAKTGRG